MITHRGTPVNKALKEPLLHFFALGLAVFALNTWRDKTRPRETSTARIEVTTAVIDRLRAGFERQFGQAPDAEELRGLVTAHIREEVLCREALALGLDRDDTIVRRRLAQKMEFLTDDFAGAVEPVEAELQRFFAERAAHYAKPPQVSFRHVYFSREKRGASAKAAATEVLAELEKGASDEAFGDPFLHGYEFAERETDDVIAAFGADFAQQLAGQPTGAWRGPVMSSYGLHLVRVEVRTEPRAVTLDEVRDAVLRDFNDERRRAANHAIFEKLRERYQVTVDEAAMTKAAALPAKAAQ